MHLFPFISEREPETKTAQPKISPVLGHYISGIQKDTHVILEPIFQSRARVPKRLLNWIKLIPAAPKHIRRKPNRINRDSQNKAPRGIVHKRMSRILRVSLPHDAKIAGEEIVATRSKSEPRVIASPLPR